MLELIEKKNAPTMKPVDVIMNGKRYGDVKPSGIDNDGLRWHAAFHGIPDGDYGYLVSILIQGHGDTPTEAIMKGFIETEATLEKHLGQLRALRAKMFPPVDVEVDV